MEAKLEKRMNDEGKDAIRFAAKKCALLSESLEEIIDKFEEKELPAAKIVHLYVASATLENAYIFMSGNLSRTIGRLEAFLELIKNEDEEDGDD